MANVNVDFNANLARFSSSVDKAINDLNRFNSRTKSIGSEINNVLGTLGVGLSAGAFVGFVKGAIDSLDRLNDLNKSTGIAVEQLAGLSLAAQQSGGDLESIADSVNKLSKNIGDDGEKYRKLGINAKEPLEAFKQLADIYVAIKDPQERASLAAEALGKSWAGAAPLLAEGSRNIGQMVANGTKLSGVTKEMVEKADAFNDKLAEMKLKVSALALPFVQLATQMLDAGKAADGFWGALAGVKTSKDTLNADFAEVETRLANLKKLRSELDPSKGFVNKLNDIVFGDVGDLDRQIKVAQQEYNTLKKMKDLANPGTPANNPPETGNNNDALDKQVCEFTGGVWDSKTKTCKKKTPKGPVDDPTKNLLNNALAGLEKNVTDESNLLQRRNSVLDFFYQENLTSISEYYRSKKAVEDLNLAATIAIYDKEIQKLEEFKKKTKDKTDIADAQGKINSLLEKRADAQQRASDSAITLSLEEKKALDDYADSIVSVNAQILELTGNLKDAALIRFDQQNKSLRERFKAEGDTSSLDKLDQLKQFTAFQAEANKISEDASLLQQKLSNTEDRINISRQVGAISELASLKQISDARANSVNDLEVLVSKYEDLAAASGNPKLLQDADNLRLKLDELKASGDLLAKKFDTIFTDSLSNAFTEFIDGSKTASEAFRAFASDVVSQINKIAAQEIASQLFGSSDSGGGVGGFFSDIFKGLFNANGNAFNQSGLIPFANGGVFGTATPFSFGGGKLGVLGERGPEAILPLKRGANGQLGIQASGGGSATIIMNIQTPDANSFRKSQPQMMAEMQRNLNRGRRIV